MSVSSVLDFTASLVFCESGSPSSMFRWDGGDVLEEGWVGYDKRKRRRKKKKKENRKKEKKTKKNSRKRSIKSGCCNVGHRKNVFSRKLQAETAAAA